MWSLFAALGLFVAGAAVSIMHGVQTLLKPEPADDFLVGYLVLAVSFVLEGVPFLRSLWQVRAEADSLQRDLLEHVLATSDPTLRAVFAEDLAALGLTYDLYTRTTTRNHHAVAQELAAAHWKPAP